MARCCRPREGYNRVIDRSYYLCRQSRYLLVALVVLGPLDGGSTSGEYSSQLAPLPFALFLNLSEFE